MQRGGICPHLKNSLKVAIIYFNIREKKKKENNRTTTAKATGEEASRYAALYSQGNPSTTIYPSCLAV